MADQQLSPEAIKASADAMMKAAAAGEGGPRKRKKAREWMQENAPDMYGDYLKAEDSSAGGLRGIATGARVNRYEADKAGETVASGIMERAKEMPTFDPSKQTDISGIQAGQTQYQDPTQSAKYITDMRSAMGLRSPEEQAGAKREAVMGSLNKESYMGALRDAQNLAQQGQSTGARSQALSVLRGSELAGKKSQAEANIQGQIDAMNQAMMGQSLQQGQVQSQFAAGQEQAAANLGMRKAGFEDQRRLQEIQSILGKQGAMTEAEMFDFGRKEGDVFRFKDMLPDLIKMGVSTAAGAAGAG